MLQSSRGSVNAQCPRKVMLISKKKMGEKEVIQAARMLKNGKVAEVDGVTGEKNI